MQDAHQWNLPDDPIAKETGSWLNGKVALVAGGGLSGAEGGVGFAIAWLAAGQGATVAILDADADAAERAVSLVRERGGHAEAFLVDVTDDGAVHDVVADVVSHFGRIDVVADSIGGGGLEGMLDASLSDWGRALDLNFLQSWYVIRHAHHHLPQGGSIVTISSSGAAAKGSALPYSIAKAALEKLTTGLAVTLAPRGIRANVVRVGMIWGAFAARSMAEDQREVRRKAVALQTEGTVWDVASAAIFLLTDRARWVSGQIVTVDGGGMAPKNVGQARPGMKKDA